MFAQFTGRAVEAGTQHRRHIDSVHHTGTLAGGYLIHVIRHLLDELSVVRGEHHRKSTVGAAVYVVHEASFVERGEAVAKKVNHLDNVEETRTMKDLTVEIKNKNKVTKNKNKVMKNKNKVPIIFNNNYL